MKNKYLKKIFLIIFFCTFTYWSNSEEFQINSEKIQIEDSGSLINASGNVEIMTNDNLIIKSNNSILNKTKSFLKASGDVYILDRKNQIEVNSNSIEYDKNLEIIFIPGSSKTKFSKDYTIVSENLYFDRNKMIIYSNNNSELIDQFGNEMKFENFEFKLNEKFAIVNQLDFTDNQKNNLKLESATINLKDREITGKEAEFFFSKDTFGNTDNDPRIFGRTVTTSKDETTIKKGVFTTCKIRKNEKCPPWLIKADEVKHNKKNKTIEYKNAWLNIYDKPVVYFPYFYHPDPTVERQSGFLMPSINNSNLLGTSIQIPYYNVMSDRRDFTVSPRVFLNDKILFQTEYRQIGKNSKTIIDHSFTKDDDSTVSHFFSNTLTELGNSNIELNIETTSKNNYLKKYLLKSPLIDSYTSLNSYLSYNNYNFEKKTNFSASIEVFENVTAQSSDSYEYVYPNYLFAKNFETNLNGELQFETSGFQRKYETNKYDALIVNNIIFNSNKKINRRGFMNEYSLMLKNVNTDGTNSKNYRNEEDYKLLSKIMLNTYYPLIKKNVSSSSYLTPKFSLRYSPTETKNEKDDNTRVDYLNLFNLDRLDNNDMIEGGESLTFGLDYKLENQQNESLFKLSAAQVFRLNDNKDIPISSTIGNKRSDIIGNLEISSSDIINFKYSFNADNDLNKLNYNLVETNINMNKLTTSFKYLSSSNFISEKSYISNKTSFNLNKNSSLSFQTNKNLDLNLTEYYDLIYEYKNDCLAAAIEYKKTYYQDSDILPDENIFFTVKILPFGKVSSLPVN